MKTNKNLIKLNIVAVVTALALVGCGGGGGGSASTGGGTTPPSGPTVTPANLQTAQTPSYATGSDQLALFTALNSFRTLHGFGPLNQNTHLDASAAAHVTYDSENTPSDTETSGAAGFTGATVQDRATAQGYTGAVGEVQTAEIATGTSVSGYGAIAAQTYLGTIYHRANLMNQTYTDIGIGFGQFGLTIGGVQDVNAINVVNLGYTGKGQNNASDFFGTYPANGQTGIALHANIESPNPLPALTTQDQFNTQTGFPISVAVAAGQTLTVSSFTVTASGQSSPMTATLITSADPNLAQSPNIAFLVASQAYQPNTTYTVKFQGSAGSTSINQTWTFTTGAN